MVVRWWTACAGAAHLGNMVPYRAVTPGSTRVILWVVMCEKEDENF